MSTDRQNSNTAHLDYPRAPRVLCVERDEFDQTLTMACSACGRRFPVLDEFTGADGLCNRCADNANFSSGEGWEGQASPQALRSGGAPTHAPPHFQAQGRDQGRSASSSSKDDGVALISVTVPTDVGTANAEALPSRGSIPGVSSSCGLLASSLLGGNVPPGARLVLAPESQQGRAPFSSIAGRLA